MSRPRRLALLLALFWLPASIVAQTTYFWTGLAANGSTASADAAGNWLNNTLPPGNSTTTGTLLSFGASNNTTTGSVTIVYSGSTEALGISFTSPRPEYEFVVSAPLGLGAQGVTVSAGADVLFYGGINLLAGQQEWSTQGLSALYVYGAIADGSGSAHLVKSGTGDLILHNSTSTFSGGLTVSSGTLYLGGNTYMDGSTLLSGPAGTGTLTLGDGTTLRAKDSPDFTLHNAIRLGNNVTLGNKEDYNGYTFTGAVTPLNTDTTVKIGADGAVFFSGPIGNAEGGATNLTFQKAVTSSSNSQLSAPTDGSFPLAILAGANTYTGSTTADGAGVIFFSPDALTHTSAIAGLNGAYVSAGFNGGMATILGKIADKPVFNGALGFDTDPSASTTNVFHDAINLSAFTNDSAGPQSGFWGLGTMTKAILSSTAVITPPTGGNYVFGGGDGTLYVQSNLTAPTGVRVRSEYGDDPLTVYLQGANTFTGNLMSDHSVVILDSASALPTGSSFSLDAGAYVGHTENTGLTPADFVARLAVPSYNADSILGFDTTAANLPTGRTITAPLDLHALNDIFIGTATHVHFGPASTLSAPSTGKLSVTGIKGGWLTIESALLAPTVSAPGVTSLNIGNTGSDALARGYVELTSGASTFTGGTTFNSGYLLLGASSSGATGAVTSGPLGTGTLTFNGFNYDYHTSPTLVATTAGLTLHNSIAFGTGTVARIGAPNPDDSNDPAALVQDYATHGLTFAGALSGSPGSVQFLGSASFHLNADSPALHAGRLEIGDKYTSGTSSTLLVVGANQALGAVDTHVFLAPGADLQFNTALPSIGSLSGGHTLNLDTTNRSYVALNPGATLTINQSENGTLSATLGGTPGNFSTNSVTTTTAALVKNGTGTLTLDGQSTYSGGTTINAGKLIAGSSTVVDSQTQTITSGPLGTGAITLNGGQLGFTNSATLANPINFGASGGKLSGSTTFTTPIAVGANVILAPGNSPGVMTFTNGLTWGPGGTLSFEIADMSGTAGVGYDTLSFTGGTFAVTATAANPFTIDVTSLTSLSGTAGLLGVTPTQSYSLTVLQSSASLAGLWGSNFETINLNTANFSSATPGLFSLSLGNGDTSLLLNFTPVPEPSTYALLSLGLLAVMGSIWRRHPSRRS